MHVFSNECRNWAKPLILSLLYQLICSTVGSRFCNNTQRRNLKNNIKSILGTIKARLVKDACQRLDTRTNYHLGLATLKVQLHIGLATGFANIQYLQKMAKQPWCFNQSMANPKSFAPDDSCSSTKWSMFVNKTIHVRQAEDLWITYAHFPTN